MKIKTLILLCILSGTIGFAFEITSISKNTIKWFGKNNKVYHVQTTTNLIAQQWQTIGIVTGNNSTITFQDNFDDDIRFYRVSRIKHNTNNGDDCNE